MSEQKPFCATQARYRNAGIQGVSKKYKHNTQGDIEINMRNQNEMWLKIKTRGNSSPRGKSKIYFTCHPDDMDKYFDEACKQILSVNDCAIYYARDMNLSYTDPNWETDLAQMNLFIIPVTFKLLSGHNRTLDTDLPFAQKKYIPVLPLVMESGLTELFKEKFGKVQYLDPNDIDKTAIPYKEKLKTYLDSVLIGVEMRKRVQDAFIAYIFLSYRKKDRKYANELIHLIHKNPAFRDVAIWYDEFLTPGEDYDENIEAALKMSHLFTLMVTPNLLEDPNYVMTIEYPKALELGKKILPIEMLETEYEKMLLKYNNLLPFVKGYDATMLNERLKKELKDIVFEASNEDPTHIFLIGLAYLEGFDVEKNADRAVEMITMAAEEELPEAIDKLAEMYHNGIGLKCEWEKWLFWLERAVSLAEKQGNPFCLIEKISDLADGLFLMNQYEDAYERYREVYVRRCSLLGKKHPDTLSALSNMVLALFEWHYYKNIDKSNKAAQNLDNLDDTLKVFSQYHMIYEIYKKEFGERSQNTIAVQFNMASIYEGIGLPRKAVELYDEISTFLTEEYGEKHPWTLKSLNGIATNLLAIGQFDEALEIYKKVYNCQKEEYGEEHPAPLTTLSNMAALYRERWRNEKDLKRSYELYTKVYESRKKVLGEGHLSTQLTKKEIESLEKTLAKP